jgi:hypothetical protein
MNPTASTPTSTEQGRTLSQLDDAERYAVYDRLQESMPEVWAAMGLGHHDESVVVVPSISLERKTQSEAPSGTLIQAYEERALFLLLLLRQPRLRMIYVTSLPVPEQVVQYYLGLLPGVIPSHARARLTLVSIGDAGPGPLSEKLLARPRLLREIRAMIPNRERCHLIPYNTTGQERDVAISLGIPMYGSDPRLADLGTKTGCRRIFEEVGVRCPVGADDLRSMEDLVAAVQDMRRRRPSIREAIIKLNEGVAGSGNAVVDLGDLPPQGSPEEPDAISGRIRSMAPEDPTVAVDTFLSAFAAGAGIVEERITGEQLTSPSVQMRALTDGSVQLLSTHDQLLGGPTGQRFLGCVFPADPGYASALAEDAVKIGRHLAGLGVLGRFAVDFVTVQDETGEWTPYAIEVNLRKGGTTHPFLTLQFLTGGSYDAERGVYTTAEGVPKHLVATDHLEDDRLKALTVEDLFDVAVTNGLHYDATRQTGVVFHMFSCLTEHGRIGFTAVGNTAEEAWQMYQHAEQVLLGEADRALEETAVT